MSEQPRSESWGGWSEARERKFTLGLQATPAARSARAEEAIAFRSPRGALPSDRLPPEPPESDR